MVSQKRLDYALYGCQVPRAARSPRRRVPSIKKVEDNQMCAFDLLATVAGKLLLEGERPPISTVKVGGEQCTDVRNSPKLEKQAEDPLIVKPCDQGSSNRSFFVPELVSHAPVVDHTVKECLHSRNDAFSGLASAITVSDYSEKVHSGKKKVNVGNGIPTVDMGSSAVGTPAACNLDDGNNNGNQVNFEVDISKKFAFCKDYSPRGSFPAGQDDVNLVIRDDDENSYGCTLPHTHTKAYRPPMRLGDRRIKRLLASKYWKVAPKSNERMQYSNDAELKSIYRNRKHFYKRQRSLKDYPFKKRRLYESTTISNCGGGSSSDGRSNSLGKTSNEDSTEGSKCQGAIEDQPFAAGQPLPFNTRGSNVKLKIKSIRVPELFIEIPETSTVGSLKRTVLEAMTAILSGELRVGVLLQGKKIRDDNKTLLQTGICNANMLDSLGFTLEPKTSQTPPPLYTEDHSSVQSPNVPKASIRYPPVPTIVNQVTQQGISDSSSDHPMMNFGYPIESDHDSAPSPPDVAKDRCTTDTILPLISVPSKNVDTLAVVPMRKSKRSEVAQRRIRRPFSVSEVEALVQAVEKLGTGRWRDVKLRAFDNAKHRTYVDLKDKWKTLVHTARISPQQRRGEPVPQELLDRVLAAHAYWSHHQSRQHFKQQQQPDTCLLL